jgi:hypothetical protein
MFLAAQTKDVLLSQLLHGPNKYSIKLKFNLSDPQTQFLLETDAAPTELGCMLVQGSITAVIISGNIRQ